MTVLTIAILSGLAWSIYTAIELATSKKED